MVKNVVAIVEDSVVEGALTDAVVGQVHVRFKLLRVNKDVLGEVTEHQSASSHPVGNDQQPQGRVRVILVQDVLEDDVRDELGHKYKGIPGRPSHESAVREFEGDTNGMAQPVGKEMAEVVTLVG